MELSGEIEDLPAINLLQYLYTGRKSGTLILDLLDAELHVYFQEGEIIWAASRNGKSIADLLLDRKELSLDHFQEAQKRQNSQKTKKPLPQILIEMNIFTLDQLKDEMYLQIKQKILDLAKREQGEFSFKNNQILSLDNIDLNILSFLKPDCMDTQKLLEGIIHDLNGDNPTDGHNQRSVQKNSGQPSLSPETLDREPDGHVEYLAGRPEEERGFALQSQSEKNSAIILLVGDGILRNLLREGIQNEKFIVITPKTVEECLDKGKQCMDRGILPFFVTEERLSETRKYGSGTSEMILEEKKKAHWISPVVVLVNHNDPASIWKLYQSGARAVLPKPIREGAEKVDFLEAIKIFSDVIQSISLQFEHEIEQTHISTPA